jgi:hypothetical protein
MDRWERDFEPSNSNGQASLDNRYEVMANSRTFLRNLFGGYVLWCFLVIAFAVWCMVQEGGAEQQNICGYTPVHGKCGVVVHRAVSVNRLAGAWWQFSDATS